MTAIIWFRQDLRLADNPALAAAAEHGLVIPVFILDESSGDWSWGGASRWWLHHSLDRLRRSLKNLSFFRGDPRLLIPKLQEETGATAVYWNRLYDAHSIKRDSEIKAQLTAGGIDARSFNAALLHEPWEIATGSGGAFKVFTPFWRAANHKTFSPPIAAPNRLLTGTAQSTSSLADLRLLPGKPDWAAGWENQWTPGEAGANEQLDNFIEQALAHYADQRDRPAPSQTSRLSPHLHWGEISPRQIAARMTFAADRPALRRHVEKFMSEIGWREFCHHLLYHWPDLPDRNWRTAFDSYPWRDSAKDFQAWERGQTGYPFVDAAMRELWRTGWVHNRARMVAASFLVKHLQIDWKQGQLWFWDTLVDADLANNAAGWQWVAGSGADASPYFRIFNPVTQGEKFDPEGDYVRRWCPELSLLPNQFIHAPFKANEATLQKAGIVLGRNYPFPIVDHAEARKAALAGYERVRKAG